MLVDVWGWVCAITGSLMAIPQVIRLLKARSSAGISLLMWQLNGAAAAAWTAHGLRGSWWNITIPNLLIALTSILVVRMVLADRRLPGASVWATMAGVTAALVAVEFLSTPALFGAAVLVPLAVGMLGQTSDLVRSPSLTGVSSFYVAMSFVIQVMWFAWGLAAGDVSIVICAGVLGVVTGFNAAWYVLRSRGLVEARVRLA